MTVRNLNYHSYQPVSYAVMTDPSIDHMLPQIPLKATFYSRRKKVEGNIFVFSSPFNMSISNFTSLNESIRPPTLPPPVGHTTTTMRCMTEIRYPKRPHSSNATSFCKRKHDKIAAFLPNGEVEEAQVQKVNSCRY